MCNTEVSGARPVNIASKQQMEIQKLTLSSGHPLDEPPLLDEPPVGAGAGVGAATGAGAGVAAAPPLHVLQQRVSTD